MTTVSGLSVSQWLASTNVSEANAIYNRNDQNYGGSSASTATGDTVTISDQAREMLQAQLTAPSDGEAGQNGSFDQNGSSDQGLPAGTSASAGASNGMSRTSSSEDQIKEIEKKIEKLGQEISELQAKAATDPIAKAQLGTKLNELAQLQTQLAELKQQQG